MMKLIILLICALLIYPAQSFGEKIYRKDGKVLDEKIAYRNRGVVWIKKPAGSIGISITDIDRIENDDGSVSKYDYKALGGKIQASIKGEKYEEAIHACSVLLESIEDTKIRYLRGALSQKIDDFDKAKEDYAFLVKEKAADASILNNLGTIYASDRKYREAIDLFIKAAAENPDMAEVHDNLAAASLQTGDYKRAMDEYERVLKEEPENTNALYNLGIIYMSKGDPGKAKELWEKALAIRPEDGDAKKALESLKAEK